MEERCDMGFLRNVGKVLKIGVTAYIVGGTTYWLTAEVYLRYIGKEITFSPFVSALLAVPFWPLDVYGDLRWIGVLPQDVAALLPPGLCLPWAYTETNVKTPIARVSLNTTLITMPASFARARAPKVRTALPRLPLSYPRLGRPSIDQKSVL